MKLSSKERGWVNEGKNESPLWGVKIRFFSFTITLRVRIPLQVKVAEGGI
jgi:hypothetical protein